jgi:hypothetical protein
VIFGRKRKNKHINMAYQGENSKNGKHFNDSIDIKKRGCLGRLFTFLAPAYLVSVGYMDTVRHIIEIPFFIVRTQETKQAQTK